MIPSRYRLTMLNDIKSGLKMTSTTQDDMIPIDEQIMMAIAYCNLLTNGKLKVTEDELNAMKLEQNITNIPFFFLEKGNVI